MELLSFAFLIVTIIVLGNHFLHSFWTRQGFPQLKPKFFVGDIGDLFRLKHSIAEVYGSLYEKSKNLKIVGIYFTYRPGLLVNDPELIQNILVKDFQHFTDHGLYVDESYDPLSGHLFSLSGDKWKNLRGKLSPLFSPGKLKLMFPTFMDCAVNLQRYVEKQNQLSNNVIEIRDLLARYTTDIIASVAFGFDNDSINETENVFRSMGAKVFKPSFKGGLRAFMSFLLPQVNMYLGIKVADQDVEDFMFTMVKQTIEFREKNGSQRNDFMQVRIEDILTSNNLLKLRSQLMIKLMKHGLVQEDGKNSFDESSKLTFEEVVAQAFVFFIAAFETSSSTMALCLFELAKNQHLQRNVQNEIDRVMEKEGAKSKEVSYDLMTEFKYLESCIDETLRKYAPAPFLIRSCTKTYAVPNTNLIIDKGTPLIISTFGLHRDPDIYENPLQFKPERFLNSSTGEGKASGIFYLPFGNGPRICIGMRMGKLTTKLGLFLLLSKFNFEFEGEIPINELTFSPQQFVLTLKDDINLKVSARV